MVSCDDSDSASVSDADLATPRRVARLLFVYDAESGRLAALADTFKKLVGRGCPLCVVTHGLTGPRSEFTALQQQLLVPVVSVHTDERDRFRISAALPKPSVVAELEQSGEQVVLLDPDAIGRLRGSERDLQGRLEFRAAALDLVLPHTGPDATSL